MKEMTCVCARVAAMRWVRRYRVPISVSVDICVREWTRRSHAPIIYACQQACQRACRFASIPSCLCSAPVIQKPMTCMHNMRAHAACCTPARLHHKYAQSMRAHARRVRQVCTEYALVAQHVCAHVMLLARALLRSLDHLRPLTLARRRSPALTRPCPQVTKTR